VSGSGDDRRRRLISDAFSSGRGVAWGEHHPELTDGTLRFFRTNYMAHASRFFGFDYDKGSIAKARKSAAEAGVADRCTFEVTTAKDYPGSNHGLVVFDALHDMGDPTGAAAHALDTLAPDRTFMIVEPFAHDRLEDNLTPVGRIGYTASTTICLPMSRAQEVDAGLGAQAGETRLRTVVTSGGFSRFRRAAQTPFNLIFEAHP
jgi:hypothetical protein